MPIAVLGCGKTSVSRALSKLFGWELEQSDAITAKRTGPTFLRKIDEALSKPLEESKVVIADRNNHLFSHRRLGGVGCEVRNSNFRTKEGEVKFKCKCN